MGFLKKYIQPTPLHVVASQVELSVEPEKPNPLPKPILKPVIANKPQAEKDPRIVAIEAEAYALGWTAKNLWQRSRRYDEKGLADLIKPVDTIAEVTRDWIMLEHTEPNGRNVTQRFYSCQSILGYVLFY